MVIVIASCGVDIELEPRSRQMSLEFVACQIHTQHNVERTNTC
jgi:hypothetical protein